MPDSPARQPPPRIVVEQAGPAVGGGRYAAKRCVGDAVTVTALVYRDGHDLIRAVAAARPKGEEAWREAPMAWIDRHVDGDTWAGEVVVDAVGDWELNVFAWTDVWGTWRDELERKVEAGQTDLEGELSEGALLVADAAERSGEARLRRAAAAIGDAAAPVEARAGLALDPALHVAMEESAERHGATSLAAPLPLWVDRPLARFGAWYELFPRSWGGFRGVAEQLPRLAELGFDVIYLPPVHPIGEANRKGRNNALSAGPDDPGSPWAIGHHAHGGHDALHPDLGDESDFATMVEAAQDAGVEIALDFAIQCSADHPWLTEHPEWFHHRPDGTLKYAENPPKRYQDIYNVNWESPDWPGLWYALKDVLLGWVDRGIRVFRVDNPHTKPFAFWEWLIREVHAVDPGVIFLAEAFTREAKMRGLAELGFTQSYTYFTWKNASWELREYVQHLARDLADVFRPNFFANTPDILHEHLVHGGPPAFHARLVLAGTLSPTYGIYSGFEHFENVPVKPGSEEYLDSEKYEIKARALDGPLLPVVQRLNAIRRAHPALQRLTSVEFLPVENEALLAYAKVHEDDRVLCVVNVDPFHDQEGIAIVPAHLGLPPTFAVRDELTGDRFDWHIGRNYVRLAPGAAHVLTPA